MANRRRYRIINFRCTDAEYEFINEKIEQSKRTKTDFLIDTLLEKEIVVHNGLTGVLSELKKQGVNLNQALKLAHSGIEKENVQIAVKECKELYKKIAEFWEENKQ